MSVEHEFDYDLLVLGAGPGGYSAAFRAADLGLKTVLVERYGTLGGVCLNVGCIPSKALLHVAAASEEAMHLQKAGFDFVKPKIDLDKLRSYKDGVVAKLTGGLAGMARARKVEVVRGLGSFQGPMEWMLWTALAPLATFLLLRPLWLRALKPVRFLFSPMIHALLIPPVLWHCALFHNACW